LADSVSRQPRKSAPIAHQSALRFKPDTHRCGPISKSWELAKNVFGRQRTECSEKFANDFDKSANDFDKSPNDFGNARADGPVGTAARYVRFSLCNL
jgi:hypothetical protein